LSEEKVMILHVPMICRWLTGSNPPTGFSMLFDGDKVDLETTPEDLDLEEGEKIDVSWKALA